MFTVEPVVLTDDERAERQRRANATTLIGA